MANRTVGLIAVGVDNPGVLSRLNGAAAGAIKVAEWLEKQKHLGVAVVSEVLTDTGDDKVSARNVRDAATRIMQGPALHLLIVYLAGHGFVRSGGSEYVLLSEFPEYQEAIDVAATARNAKRVGVPHVVVITDACRSSADAFGPVGEINGSPVFKSGPVQGTMAGKVDVFFATEPSQTAKEYKGEGFFTKILLDALEYAPAEVREAWPGGQEVIPAWRMEHYLETVVPARAFAHNPSFEQIPDFQVTSREPMFLAYVPQDNSNEGPAFMESPRVLRKNTRVFGINIKRSSANSDSKLRITPESRRQALEQVVTLMKSSGDLVPPNVLSDAGLLERVKSYRGVDVARLLHGSRTGYSFFGVQVDSVTLDPMLKAEINTSDGGSVDLRLSGNLSEAKSASVIVRLGNGTTCILPFLAGYVGAVDLRTDHISSIAFATNIRDTKRFGLFDQDEAKVRQQKEIASALASTGQLWRLAGEDAASYAAFVRKNKQLDPSLGIYASYAYALAGRDDDARSVYDWFVGYQQPPFQDQLIAPIIFDVGMLGGAFIERLPAQQYPLAPFCPMMGIGWSLLESCGAGDLHPALAQAGRVRLSSEWTLFPTDKVQPLFDAFERGELR